MSLSGKIETVANAATIFVAILISVVLIKAHLVADSSTHKAPVVTSEVSLGQRVDGSLLGVDWAKNHRTLVLAISTTCHFCKESVPFYRQLGAARANVRMVAVLPQTVTESKEYLSSAGVRVDDVKQVPLTTLGVRGTPTLVLVNDVGMVTAVWAGKLSPDEETQVLSAMGKVVGGD